MRCSVCVCERPANAATDTEISARQGQSRDTDKEELTQKVKTKQLYITVTETTRYQSIGISRVQSLHQGRPLTLMETLTYEIKGTILDLLMP